MSSYNRRRRYDHPQQEFDWRPLLFGAGGFALARALSQDKASRPAAHRAAEPNWWCIAAIAGALATPAAIKWLDRMIAEMQAAQPKAAPVLQPPKAPSFELTAPQAQPASIEAPSLDWSQFLTQLSALQTPDTDPQPAWEPPSDAQWLKLVRHPAVVLILGKRGSGKSALGYRLLELLRGHSEPYVVGLSEKAAKLLPPWVGLMAELKDVPAKAVVLVDESYLLFHARGSMLSAGRTIGALINLSRQRQQTLIFSVQEARQLDVNIVSQIDVLAVKALSDLSQGFERPQLRRLTDKARAAFETLKGELRCWSWVYAEPAHFEGLIRNQLASFWSPALSRAFAQSSDALVQRRGQRPARKELKARAQSLHKAGLSYAQIAQNLGVSKTTAWRLLHGGKGSHTG